MALLKQRITLFKDLYIVRELTQGVYIFLDIMYIFKIYNTVDLFYIKCIFFLDVKHLFQSSIIIYGSERESVYYTIINQFAYPVNPVLLYFK